MSDIPGTSGEDLRNGTGDADLITGLGGNDILNGLAGDDTLAGGGGDDVLSGGLGNDTLKGGGGDDTLNGDEGDDLLIGAKGADTLDGGEGSDTYRIVVKDAGTVDTFADSGSSGVDTLDATRVEQLELASEFDASTGIEVILGDTDIGTVLFGGASPVLWDFALLTLTDVDQVKGSGGDDNISGSEGDDKIKGLGGDDTLSGNGGDDKLIGGGGADSLKGDAGDDVLKGGGGGDVLDGGLGDDRLLGGGGDDTLIYDAADSDEVYGGGGEDTLAVAGAGVELDLTATSGTAHVGIEVIDLTGTGANVLLLNKGAVRDLSEETNTLRVDGGADDAVITTGGEWTAAADTVIGSVTYQVYSNGNVTLQVQDGIITGGINTPVNDGPVAGDDATITSENSPVTTVDVLLNDLDADGDTLSITGADPISAGGATVTNNGNGTFTYTPGTLFDALASGETTTDTFSYTISDGNLTDAGTVTITLTGVNDAPVIAGDLSATIAEGVTYTLTLSDLSEADPDDSGTGLAYTVTSVTNGTVKLSGSATTTFTAQNVADGLVTFTHDGSETGSGGCNVSLADGLEDGVAPDSDTFSITVTAVNDAPVNTVPGAQTPNWLEDNVISGISVADADAGANAIQITLSTNLGSLSLSQTTGLTFTTGDGSGDTGMVFMGTLSNVNAALNLLVFHATEAGTGTITLSTNDLGNSGAGGNLLATDNIGVTVSAEIDLSSLDGTNGLKFSGVAEYDFSGFSVSAAGDVNGDGLADLLIGAFGAEPTSASYVVFGATSGFSAIFNLSALDGTNGFQVSGVAAGDFFGSSVSTAGDVNGDGFADVIVGAPFEEPNGFLSGASYVVFGASAGFVSNFNPSALDGTNGFKISGVTTQDNSGKSVSEAGDVNGDGFADIIIGAPQAGPNGYASGASYVVFGADSGLASNLNLSDLDGTNGFKVSGVAAGDRSGISVSTAGDVNGDGYADLLIGAHFAAPNGYASGASYVVFGAVSGFSANLNLSALDGTNGFKISGVAVYDLSGVSVSMAGDVNGDGFADIIIGAPQADPNGYDSGASYVVFGADSGLASNLNLSALDGTNGFKISGVAAFDRSGSSVSAAGDFNGDGFADVLIGAKDADPNGSGSGASYMVFGADSGFTSNLNLSALDGTNGFKVSGVAASDFSGYSVSAAGDVNGDGFADVLIGARGADPNGSYSGASYVLFGRDVRNEVDFLGTDGDDTLTGNTNDNILIGGLGNDTLNGEGGADVLKGAAGIDTLDGGAGNDLLEGGTGNDLLGGGADDDRLEGQDGADTLDGGAGNDVLVGGSDNDIFLFDDSLGATNVDTIMDFGGAGATMLDVIHLDNSIFTALAEGALSGVAFESGTDDVANSADTRIIYNMTTGALFYDADGDAGGSSAIQFAVIATDVDGLSAADFVVV